MQPKRVSSRRQILVSCLLPSCLLLLALLLFASCASTPPVFKIGLVAPFEGRYRPIGYDAVWAVRLAVRQVNAGGGIAGYRVELMAMDDGGDTQVADRQARLLALDPAVMGVIGHWRADTTQAAAPLYAEQGVPLLVPANVPAGEWPSAIYLGPTWEQLSRTAQAIAERVPQAQVILEVTDPLLVTPMAGNHQGVLIGGPDLAFMGLQTGLHAEGTFFVTGAPWPQDLPGTEAFVADYQAVAGGAAPGPYAWAAYRAAQVPLEAVGRDLQAHGAPSRGGVDGQLRALVAGSESPVYLYRYEAAGRPVLIRR